MAAHPADRRFQKWLSQMVSNPALAAPLEQSDPDILLSILNNLAALREARARKILHDALKEAALIILK